MSDSEEFENDVEDTWINWFCKLEDHHFFAEIDEQFIRDSFNLYGIKQLFPNYKQTL